MHFGAWFDVLQVGLWVFVEDDAWVHNLVWVEELFHFAHELVGIIAPFASHEWSHIASRTVLGFERTVVFVHYQVHHSAHHAVILLDGFGCVKTLVENKVVVALECVAVDDRLGVVMLAEELLQVECGLCQVLDRESNILNEAGRSHFACSSHSREDTRAHSPILAGEGRVAGESGRLAEGIGIEYRLQGAVLLVQFLLGSSIGADKHGTCIRR